MKKIYLLLVLILSLLLVFVGCSKDAEKENEPETESTSDIWGDDNWWETESSTEYSDNGTINNQELPSDDSSMNNDSNFNNQQNSQVVPDNSNNQNNNTNSNNSNSNNNISNNSGQSNSLISDEDISKIQDSQAEVFYSDNPNNKYILAVVNKYGVDSSNLVALVKVNASFPSALVLEFSGKRDANGELVMTYDELKYVYNIDESNNTLVRASKSATGNDGVSYVESKMLFYMMEEYFIPELPNLKANKRYPD